jgi:hypothetical protein
MKIPHIVPKLCGEGKNLPIVVFLAKIENSLRQQTISKSKARKTMPNLPLMLELGKNLQEYREFTADHCTFTKFVNANFPAYRLQSHLRKGWTNLKRSFSSKVGR